MISAGNTTVELEQRAVSDKQDIEPKPQATSISHPDADCDLLLQALKGLKDVIPRRKPGYSTTLQDMTDMTSLIASKMYAPKVHTPIEGEVRKELRAAKGLLLNRYANRAAGLYFLSSHLKPVPCRKTFTAVKATS